ncbi:MAG: hypothetical protein OQJ97_06180 [Rhodospirillales bacterium]|nr:hypothetical protein [Rhodospirillales bacterium]
MRLWVTPLLFITLVGCASGKIEIDPKTGLALTSYKSYETYALAKSNEYCRSGRCSKTPVLMLAIRNKLTNGNLKKVTLSDIANLKGFIFAGTTVYDGRLSPLGAKYLSYRDIQGDLVCQGYYDWSGFGSTSDVELRCFEEGAEVKGKIRTIGRQPKGPFKGRGMGTGALPYEGGLIAVIYGIDPTDLKEKNFKELWVQHGGSADEIPFNMPKRIKKVPLLNGGKAI